MLLVVMTVVTPALLPVLEVLSDVWLEVGAVYGVPEFCWVMSHHPPTIMIKTIIIPMTHAMVLLLFIGCPRAIKNSNLSILTVYA